MKKRIIMIITMCLLILQSLMAQEVRKFEFGASTTYGIGIGKETPNNAQFELSAGYKINEHISTGVGFGYRYSGGIFLSSSLENVFITTKQNHAFRPFLYGRYVFLPEKKWTPSVGAKIGYAFFANSTVNYNINPLALYPEGAIMYGDVDVSEYEYLKDLDHTLAIKSRLFGTIDFGVSRKIGKNGNSLSLGVSMEIQPMTFHYLDKTESRIGITIGPSMSFSF